MAERRCENCNRELAYHWWELERREEIPVPGEGGGIYSRYLAQFCNPTCIAEWWASRSDRRKSEPMPTNEKRAGTFPEWWEREGRHYYDIRDACQSLWDAQAAELTQAKQLFQDIRQCEHCRLCATFAHNRLAEMTGAASEGIAAPLPDLEAAFTLDVADEFSQNLVGTLTQSCDGVDPENADEADEIARVIAINVKQLLGRLKQPSAPAPPEDARKAQED